MSNTKLTDKEFDCLKGLAAKNGYRFVEEKNLSYDYYKLRETICDRRYYEKDEEHRSVGCLDRIWESEEDLFDFFGEKTLFNLYFMNNLYNIEKWNSHKGLVEMYKVLDFIKDKKKLYYGD